MGRRGRGAAEARQQSPPVPSQRRDLMGCRPDDGVQKNKRPRHAIAGPHMKCPPPRPTSSTGNPDRVALSRRSSLSDVAGRSLCSAVAGLSRRPRADGAPSVGRRMASSPSGWPAISPTGRSQPSPLFSTTPPGRPQGGNIALAGQRIWEVPSSRVEVWSRPIKSRYATTRRVVGWVCSTHSPTFEPLNPPPPSGGGHDRGQSRLHTRYVQPRVLPEALR